MLILCSYAILIAVIVLSSELPLALNRISPFTLVKSLTEIRRFPAGLAREPERETVTGFAEPALDWVVLPLAITVVPSHSLIT